MNPTDTKVRPSSALRIRQPAEAVRAVEPQAPSLSLVEAQAGIVVACRQGRLDFLSRFAAAAAEHVSVHAPVGTLIRQLAELQAPAAAAGIGEEQLWLLRRLDGSPVGLFRLRADGEVGVYPQPDIARWQLRDGTLCLYGFDGGLTVAFSVHGLHHGRQVHVGVREDGSDVLVLSEVGCYYAKLRCFDPERLGTLAAAMQSEPLPDFGLPAVPAVVLAAPRTGSHLLLNLLNSTGQVLLDAEIFNFEKISVFGADLPSREARALMTLRATDPVQFAKVMMTRSHHVDGRMLDGVGVRGFKLFPEQSPAVLRWIMEDTRVRIVHLHRPNLLAEYSSMLVAAEEGHWVGGPEALKQRRIPFNASRFMRFVESRRIEVETMRGRLAQRGGPSTEIAYGDFTRTKLNGVLSFLVGQPCIAHYGSLGLKRQLNGVIVERFEDPELVMRCLAQLGAEAWAQSETNDVTAV